MSRQNDARYQRIHLCCVLLCFVRRTHLMVHTALIAPRLKELIANYNSAVSIVFNVEHF